MSNLTRKFGVKMNYALMKMSGYTDGDPFTKEYMERHTPKRLILTKNNERICPSCGIVYDPACGIYCSNCGQTLKLGNCVRIGFANGTEL